MFDKMDGLTVSVGASSDNFGVIGAWSAFATPSRTGPTFGPGVSSTRPGGATGLSLRRSPTGRSGSGGPSTLGSVTLVTTRPA